MILAKVVARRRGAVMAVGSQVDAVRRKCTSCTRPDALPALPHK